MPDIDMDFDERYRGEMIRYAAERYGVRPRGPDRDLLDHQGPGRGARCRPGARLPLRRGRQDRQGDAAAASWVETPRWRPASTASRATTTATPPPASCATCTRPTTRPGGSSTWPRDSRACAARTASTPPPWSSPTSRSPSTCRSSASPRAATTPTRPPSSPSTRCTESRSSGCSRWTSSGCATSRSSNGPSTSSPSPTGEPARHRLHPARRPRHLRHAVPAGDSIGVFQLEGGPMRSLMRSLAPTSFDDVAALVALYRPGPMAANMHRDYADRKNGRQPVSLPPPRPRGDPRRHLRADDLPGVGHAGGPEASPATPWPRPTTSARRAARRSGP